MTDRLFFSRDTKVYVQKGSGGSAYHWEIPVLDGFSFSQATNTSEITLAEMSDATGNSRRGRQMFNTSLAPAEWSFSTYARPFTSGGSSIPNKANATAGYHHAVEEVLWAQMVGDGTYETSASTGGGATFASGGTAIGIADLGATFTQAVNGAVTDSTTVVFSNIANIKIGQRATLGGTATHVTNIDTASKTVTFASAVTVANAASITFSRTFGVDKTVTVQTETNNNGEGATVQIAYDDSASSFTVTIVQAGAGYAGSDTLSISQADVAAAFSTALGRTIAADYTASPSNGTLGTPATPSAGTSFTGFTRSNSSAGLQIGFGSSNKTTLGTFDLVFVLGGSTGTDTKQQVYRITNCCVNEAGLDFDIDGITTINWSGMGTVIQDQDTTGPEGTLINEATADTSNFIRNRLTSLTASSGLGDDGSTTSYDLVLTGGNITISNNMTYLTPETLGIVNTPLGHVTGTRSVTGSFTCYLNKEDNSSAELFKKLIGNTTAVTNVFQLQFNVGSSSTSPVAPRIEFDMDNCHLEVPTHSIEDVISLEASFHALPSTVEQTDEVSITYVGA